MPQGNDFDLGPVSQIMVVLYIRDRGNLGFLTQPHFSSMTASLWQYWLGITNPKNVFGLTPNPFNKIKYIAEFFTA